MKQTPTPKELFGEIRSCVNGATCDLSELIRWIHEVERDYPSVDAYGYVTHHLGGTPRLWKLMKNQPLDALELLGSLESPAEYHFVRDVLPDLALEVENIWQQEFEGLELTPALRFELYTGVYRHLFDEMLPLDSPHRELLDCLDISYHDSEFAWAALRDESRPLFSGIIRELEMDMGRLSDLWDLSGAIDDFGRWGFPALGQIEVSPIAHCINAFLLLCSTWGQSLYCIPFNQEPFNPKYMLFDAMATAANVKGHLLVARGLGEHDHAFAIALEEVVRQMIFQFLDHHLHLSGAPDHLTTS